MTDRNGRERGYDERGGGLSRGALPPRGRPVAIPAVPEPHRYAMADLERETELDARTIRYYITRGLLQPAHGRGPSATYDLGHLLRLRMIQLLKNDHLPLDDIKTRLAELTDRDIAALLEVQTRPVEDRWRRLQLHPDVELHIRERAGKQRDLDFDRAVEALVKFAETYLPYPEDRR
jgi:DNA-binding transcriptional MerR regulator